MKDTAQNFPSYGVVAKYLGGEGQRYFDAQDYSGILAAKYNRFIFQPYLTEQDDVLDFGCGGGHLLNSFNVRTKVGVEINPVARAHAAQLGISVFSELDNLQDCTFSKVITSHALEHVPNPFDALVHLKRLLRKDGMLIWLSPLDDWRTKHQRGWKPNDPDMHLYAWTPLLMGNLLCAAGYKPLHISVLAHATLPDIVGERLWRISPSLYGLAASIRSVLQKRRQLVAIGSIAEP